VQWDFLSKISKETYFGNLTRVCIQKKSFLKIKCKAKHNKNSFGKKHLSIKIVTIKLFTDIFIYRELPMKNQHICSSDYNNNRWIGDILIGLTHINYTSKYEMMVGMEFIHEAIKFNHDNFESIFLEF
jgi:hypothetical protein